ncbi:MAG: elongation factor P hydroxylase [Hahellaceae bacterium]|nr:elongation factor P hydroxylase [Hahellaceae bacterium]
MGSAVTSTGLERLFNECFGSRFNTQLQGGSAEPFYSAATAAQPAYLYYREDFVRSALHEIAHWCVAGEQRRQKDDFGYWYHPEGRNAQQQAAFLQVEVLPQSFELIFCAAAGLPFRVSLDNLSGASGDIWTFELQVLGLAHTFPRAGHDGRALDWRNCLMHHYRQATDWQADWIDQVFTSSSGLTQLRPSRLAM